MSSSLSPYRNCSRERKRGYAKADRHIPLINLLYIIIDNLNAIVEVSYIWHLRLESLLFSRSIRCCRPIRILVQRTFRDSSVI